jgi:hypothetical protein
VLRVESVVDRRLGGAPGGGGGGALATGDVGLVGTGGGGLDARESLVEDGISSLKASFGVVGTLLGGRGGRPGTFDDGGTVECFSISSGSSVSSSS